MKQRARGMGVGTVSLIMIFAVLCLTVFAMLTLSTSSVEKLLADRTASFVGSYYEADSLATGVMADLITEGEDYPPSVRGVEVSYEEAEGATLASYSCRINEVQDLSVELALEGGEGTVIRWEVEYSQDWEFDPGLDVWDMDDFLGSIMGE